MPVYTIRGVGMNSFQASDTSSVGLYVDDVFQTSVATMGAFLYDIDRVEVLKGPQGTLFGRNTNGGAINYLTKAPSMESSDGYVRADYSRFNRIELEAAFGGPISDNWAARGSFMTIQQSDGVVYDRTSGTDIGEVDIWAVRGQLLYQPSDDFSVRAIVFASTDQSQPVYFQHFGTLDGAFSATPCQAFREGRLDPNTCFDLLGYSDTDGDPYAGDYTDDFDTEINSKAHLDNENVGATLHIDKAFGNMDFRSVTSFQTYDRFQPKESDGRNFGFHQIQKVSLAGSLAFRSRAMMLKRNRIASATWTTSACVSDCATSRSVSTPDFTPRASGNSATNGASRLAAAPSTTTLILPRRPILTSTLTRSGLLSLSWQDARTLPG
jgi:iron complex outermembrane receptor protein